MTHDFPARYQELGAGFAKLRAAIPETVDGFFALHRSAIADGSLPGAMKELIALAIGIAGHCDGCIAFHVHDALEAGATPEEITETIGVAVMMGGGPSMVYGADAFEALQQFTEA